MNEELKQAGFNVERLSPEQKDIIMQPLYGPENYSHDGEFTPKENLQIWLDSLKRSGLGLDDIARARKMHGL